MSPINSVQGPSSVTFSPAVPAKPPTAKAASSAAESAAQEATESASVTRTEAAKGDQQAIRRLAASTPPAQPAAQAAKPAAPSAQPAVQAAQPAAQAPLTPGKVDLQA